MPGSAERSASLFTAVAKAVISGAAALSLLTFQSAVAATVALGSPGTGGKAVDAVARETQEPDDLNTDLERLDADEAAVTQIVDAMAENTRSMGQAAILHVAGNALLVGGDTGSAEQDERSRSGIRELAVAGRPSTSVPGDDISSDGIRARLPGSTSETGSLPGVGLAAMTQATVALISSGETSDLVASGDARNTLTVAHPAATESSWVNGTSGSDFLDVARPIGSGGEVVRSVVKKIGG